MLSNSEKNEFLNTIFERIPADAEKEAAIEEIRGVLLADTKGGKLYKFRTVSDYSISNLRDGTMYCAIPSSFNDPFDCKMGLEVQSSIIAKLEKETENVEDYFIKFVKIQNRELLIDDCSERETEVFKKWLANDDFLQFVEKLINTEIAEDEVKEAIVSNFNIIRTLFMGCVSDEMVQKNIEEANKVFPAIIQNASPEKINYFKEELSLKSLANLMGVEVDADEIKLLVKMNEQQGLDLDGKIMQLDEDFTKISRELGESIDNEYRICSLCTDYTNRLMWSHYADGHKGFCIEYDFEKDTEIYESALLLPVVYSRERVKFPWNVVYAEDKEAPAIKREAAYAKLRTLLIKDDIWEYEHEWRLIVMRKSGIENVKMPPVSCIYVGAMCSDENKNMLKCIAKELNVPIKQMVVDRGEYLLHAETCDY